MEGAKSEPREGRGRRRQQDLRPPRARVPSQRKEAGGDPRGARGGWSLDPPTEEKEKEQEEAPGRVGGGGEVGRAVVGARRDEERREIPRRCAFGGLLLQNAVTLAATAEGGIVPQNLHLQLQIVLQLLLETVFARSCLELWIQPNWRMCRCGVLRVEASHS